MKKILSVILICLMLCVYAEEDIEALRRENAALKEENARLTRLVEASRDPSVIAVFDGGTVRFDEVYELYSQAEAMFVELAEIMGEDYSAYDDAYEMQIEITRNLAESKILDRYIADNGIVLLTDEQLRQAEAQGREEYALTLEETILYYLEEGLDAEAAEAAAKEELIEQSGSEEDCIEARINAARSEALVDLLAGDIVVTDEDLQAEYEARLASDREYYRLYPEDYAIEEIYFPHSVTYIPEGYRRARLLLIPFDAEAMALYDTLFILPTEPDQEAIDALFEALLPEAEAVCARLEAGESFDALLSEYPAGMEYMAELCTESGFCVCPGCYLISNEAVDAVLALTRPGETTAPVRTDWGWGILEYTADLPSGPVAMEDVRDSLYESAYESARLSAYEDAVLRICEDAGIVYFFDRLN